ncbi:hypothetical protein F8M41_009833 [Gigaspora margarita]|uniref:Uncharacterized protein n=1 Tax=Gigaspora margarita TaxID=4874 RepID=A0A8H4EQB4_GIGMA|nr:hypothetical protein F8M41_009833 [Gigaspora margarita]
MKENDTTTPNNPTVDDDLVENYDAEQADNNAWIPMDEMLNFTTTIHKDNLLSKSTRAEILKEQPRNAQIKYEAPHMDKRIWKLMSPQAKDTDKLLSKVAYHSSATLHPLDNTLRAIYHAKPDTNSEALQAWNCIESSLKDTRALYWITFPILMILEDSNLLKSFLQIIHHLQKGRKYLETTSTQLLKEKMLQKTL